MRDSRCNWLQIVPDIRLRILLQQGTRVVCCRSYGLPCMSAYIRNIFLIKAAIGSKIGFRSMQTPRYAMSFSREIEDEIRRVMRDPNALPSSRGARPGSGGHDHYDPHQPRVPAGNSNGGQWTSGGGQGGTAGREARVRLASLDAAQLAQRGSGNPRDAYGQAQPFDGLFGDISAAQHLTSQDGFNRAETDRRTNPRTRVRPFEAGAGGPNNSGRYIFLATDGLGVAQHPAGMQMVVSSTTYAYDKLTGAYATIRATPSRPIEILEIDGKVYIGSFR
jgi:hypothetical protein